jgi:hypothetical protein
MKDLFDRYVSLTEQVNKALNFQGRPRPGNSSSDAAINAVEAKFNIELPESYKEFLKLFDGCKSFSVTYDLLSTSDMTSPEGLASIDRFKSFWIKNYENLIERETKLKEKYANRPGFTFASSSDMWIKELERVKSAVVIGVSNDNNTSGLLIDYSDAERPIVAWHNGPEFVFKSFREFLQKMIEAKEGALRSYQKS